MSGPDRIPSHWWPRTREGRRSLIAFLVVFALGQPPVVWLLADRIEPRVLGMPFLYAWLLGVYVALAAILIATWRRGV